MLDDYMAKKLEGELVGKTLGGWSLQEQINHGKSAIVFRAEKNGTTAALKVFDPEIVERYGRDTQKARIDRERSLIGKTHPNLVQIYDGGQEGELFFVVMEYVKGQDLAAVLQAVPASQVRSLLAQIAAAAKFLEDAAFAHRDIKPANIGISPDFTQAKLLDLGVIRPLDPSNVTDPGDQRFFVGTLQYSPPELLFREEEHSLEAWRAITFYQLGAVLHDLLMRKPLFEEYATPYAQMVRAVEKVIPRVDAPEADADLRLLAQNCLAKQPRLRLDTVKWEDFSLPKVVDPAELARRRIAQRRMAAAQVPREEQPVEDLVRMQAYALRSSIEAAVVNTCSSEALPAYTTMRTKESPYVLRMTIPPAPGQGLEKCFAFYCQARILDVTGPSHELRIAACAAASAEMLPAEAPGDAPFFTAKGALIEQDIRLHVQTHLLQLFARALDDASNEAVKWLSLEGGE